MLGSAAPAPAAGLPAATVLKNGAACSTNGPTTQGTLTGRAHIGAAPRATTLKRQRRHPTPLPAPIYLWLPSHHSVPPAIVPPPPRPRRRSPTLPWSGAIDSRGSCRHIVTRRGWRRVVDRRRWRIITRCITEKHAQPWDSKPERQTIVRPGGDAGQTAQQRSAGSKYQMAGAESRRLDHNKLLS